MAKRKPTADVLINHQDNPDTLAVVVSRAEWNARKDEPQWAGWSVVDDVPDPFDAADVLDPENLPPIEDLEEPEQSPATYEINIDPDGIDPDPEGEPVAEEQPDPEPELTPAEAFRLEQLAYDPPGMTRLEE